jgi:peptidoglycan/LPS O-acetylase OafA/YrhL
VNDDLQLGWGGLAAYLLIVLATSGVLYNWLEKPAQAALNARAPGFAARRPAMP